MNCEGVRSEDCDSDGELVSVETCVFAVFEFISGLVESRRLRGLLPPILPTLAHNLIAHMQLTEDEVDQWMVCTIWHLLLSRFTAGWEMRHSLWKMMNRIFPTPCVTQHMIYYKPCGRSLVLLTTPTLLLLLL